MNNPTEKQLNQSLPETPTRLSINTDNAHLPHFGFINADDMVSFWTPDVIRQLVANLTYLLDEFEKNPPPPSWHVLVRFGGHGFDIFAGPPPESEQGE